MKKLAYTKKRLFGIVLYSFLSALLMVGCSKNDPKEQVIDKKEDPKEEPETPTPGGNGSNPATLQIGVFWPPQFGPLMTNTSFRYMSEAYVDMLQYADPYDQTSNTAILNLANSYGLKVTISDPRINGTDSDIASLIAANRNHPALGGYYIKDEPDMSQLDWAANTYKKVLTMDSEHVPYVNLFPDIAVGSGRALGNINYEQDYVRAWVSKVGASNLKYLSVDMYPYRTNNRFYDSYYNNLDIIRKVALENGNIKTSAYLQSVGIEGSYRRPNQHELRFNVYSMLSYGIKYPVWFTYTTPVNRGDVNFSDAIIDKYGEKTDLYTPFQQLNKEMKKLGVTLMKLESHGVYHTGSSRPTNTKALPSDFFVQLTNSEDQVMMADFRSRQADGNRYFMVVNRSYTEAKTVKLKLTGDVESLKEVEKDTGAEKVIPVDASNQFTVDFVPGDGRLYIVKLK